MCSKFSFCGKYEYIVKFTVAISVLIRQISGVVKCCDCKTDGRHPQMKSLNMVAPSLTHFFACNLQIFVSCLI